MALNAGTIYSIPEHPAEDLHEENYCEMFLSVKEVNISKVTKKISSTSLPERLGKSVKNDNKKEHSIPTLIMTEVKDQQPRSATGTDTFKKNVNRLSISLVDFSKCGLTTSDKETFKTDKGKHAFARVASSRTISESSSKSYLTIQDRYSNSNQEPEYETLLSVNTISITESNQKSNSRNFIHDVQTTERKDSGNLVFIDLNEDDGRRQSTGNADEPPVLRPRSRSMQWIQNTFQNVSNKYKFFLEFRRPSDIVEERMRKSNEELEMEESESDLPTENSSTTAGGRRFSENVIGKQKKSLFPTSLWKGLWKDKNAASKRQEEKDSDQNRTDVCPLFTFPRKRDEDEVILDALRQAMRKCTAVDPSSRPTASTVLNQLSNLIDET